MVLTLGVYAVTKKSAEVLSLINKTVKARLLLTEMTIFSYNLLIPNIKTNDFVHNFVKSFLSKWQNVK